MTTVARASCSSDEALCNDYGTTFRNYKEQETPRQRAVAAFYATQHAQQTYAFASAQQERFGKLDNSRMTLWEAAGACDSPLLWCPLATHAALEHVRQSS